MKIDLLKLPSYALLCSVQVTETVEKPRKSKFMSPGVRDWSGRNSKSTKQDENGSTQKTIFRKEVVQLLIKYAIYEKSEEGAK